MPEEMPENFDYYTENQLIVDYYDKCPNTFSPYYEPTPEEQAEWDEQERERD